MTDDRYAKGLEILAQLDPHAAEHIEEGLRDIAPHLARYVVEFPFGTVYANNGATLRDREIAACAALAAQGGLGPQLKAHIRYALNAGVSREEMVEILITVALYAGFPAALNGLSAAREAFAEADERAIS